MKQHTPPDNRPEMPPSAQIENRPHSMPGHRSQCGVHLPDAFGWTDVFYTIEKSGIKIFFGNFSG